MLNKLVASKKVEVVQLAEKPDSRRFVIVPVINEAQYQEAMRAALLEDRDRENGCFRFDVVRSGAEALLKKNMREKLRLLDATAAVEFVSVENGKRLTQPFEVTSYLSRMRTPMCDGRLG